MNAGDEMRLRFADSRRRAAGWRRDFVLIGDGWEKDGDYNTGFSQTVLPLPSHDRPDVRCRRCRASSWRTIPCTQRHREDWQRVSHALRDAAARSSEAAPVGRDSGRAEHAKAG